MSQLFNMSDFKLYGFEYKQPINVLYTKPVIVSITDNSIFKFLQLLDDCYDNEDINIYKAQIITLEAIRNNHNIFENILMFFKNKAYFINTQIKHNFDSYINHYNQYFNFAIKLRKILKCMNNCILNSCNKDYIYIISCYYFYSQIINNNFITNLYKYINRYINSNNNIITDIIRTIYHYYVFIRVFEKNQTSQFSIIKIDLSDFDFSKLIDKINTYIDVELREYEKDTDIKHIEEVIKNIKIYTSIDIFNNIFIKNYAKHLKQRNISKKIETELIKAFDIQTNKDDLINLQEIIYDKELSNNLINKINIIKTTDIKLSDKYRDYQQPDINKIKTITIDRNNTDLQLCEQNNIIPISELSIYIDIVGHIFNGITDTKIINYDIFNSTINFDMIFDKKYTITTTLAHYIILHEINRKPIDIKELYEITGIELEYIDNIIKQLIDMKLIKYDNIKSSEIILSVGDIEKLIYNTSTINIVDKLKELITTQNIIINKDFNTEDTDIFIKYNNIKNINIKQKLIKIGDQILSSIIKKLDQYIIH